MLRLACCLLLLPLAFSGCQSPYYGDRLAAAGGLTGAGLGAIVGNQTGDAGEGAVVGAALGALTGAVVGQGLDEVAQQNRAAIAGQLGRQVSPGAATIPEVISMHRAGVDPQLIRGYVETSGLAAPLGSNDVIALTQEGVPTDVIQTMQRVAAAPPAPPQTAVVHEPYYPPPVYCGPPGWHRARYCPPGSVAWGVSVGL